MDADTAKVALAIAAEGMSDLTRGELRLNLKRAVAEAAEGVEVLTDDDARREQAELAETMTAMCEAVA